MIRTPSQRLPVLALVLVALALALPAAASEPLLVAGPSVWRDGSWLPLAAEPTAEADTRATGALRSAAAAATEGSQIRGIFPLIRSDGSAEVAVFAAVVDGQSCLWRTDGTAAGTFRIETAGECVPLLPSSSFVGFADGVAYFVGGHFPYRYWRTDGTAAGTWPLTDFFDEGLSSRPFNFIAAPPLGLVVFVGNDGVHGESLWVSDGSPESAQRLDVPELEGTRPFAFQRLGTDILFFVWRDGFLYELWKTDGTAAGTTMIETVGSEEFHAGPFFLYPVDAGLVFFLRGSSPCWVELWTTDGTAAGTEPVRGFTGTSCPTSGIFQAGPVAGFPGNQFFATDDGVHGVELWRTNGTPAGTFPVTNLGPPQPFPSSFPLNPRPVGLGGEIFFEADDGVHGMELWKSDGTPGGSSLVVDLCPGACSGDPGWLSVVGSHLVFSAEIPAFGRELWVSDGSAAGTQRATDLCPGACGASIFREVVFGDSLLFIADDGTNGQEWWIFTPPAGPAVRLTDLAPPSPFGTFLNMTPLDGRAVFTADDGVHGREPWVTDGTPAGTHLLADLQGDPPVIDPPTAPGNLQLVNLGGGRVRLTWEDRSDDEDVFLVEGSRNGSPFFVQTVVDENTTTVELDLARDTWVLRVLALKSGVSSAPSNEVGVEIGFCAADNDVLCLGDHRFRVQVTWRNQHAEPGQPNTGVGGAVPAGTDSGYFWFFTPDNLELVVKILDGTTVNGHFWVFWGGLSDVEYTIEIEDVTTHVVRTYHNPPGQICGGSDTRAFPALGVPSTAVSPARAGAAPSIALASPAPFAVASGPATRFVALDAPKSIRGADHLAAPCVADEETLCLLDGMLAVTVDWTDQHNGGSGVGQAVPYTDITGFFWFFHPENVELVVKALDGRTVNGKIWVFYGALSDVGYTIRVENRADGHAVRTYTNPPGTICGNGDTAAF